MKNLIVFLILSILTVFLNCDYGNLVETGRLISTVRPDIGKHLFAYKVKDIDEINIKVYKILKDHGPGDYDEKKGYYFRPKTTVVEHKEMFYLMPNEFTVLLDHMKINIDSTNVFDVCMRFLQYNYKKKLHFDSINFCTLDAKICFERRLLTTDCIVKIRTHSDDNKILWFLSVNFSKNMVDYIKVQYEGNKKTAPGPENRNRFYQIKEYNKAVVDSLIKKSKNLRKNYKKKPFF